MKILKILFGLLFVVVVLGVIGLFIFIKTFDISSYKPKIIAKVSEVLDRDVDFENIDFKFSFKRGLKLDLVNLKISGDSDFQEDDFLNVARLSLGVDVIAFLTKREIVSPDIQIVSPKIKIIRRADGQLNLQNIGRKKTNKEDKKNDLISKSALALPLIIVNTMNLKNGTVVYVDKTFEPELVLEISRLSVEINRFSLKDSFPFIIKGAIFSNKENINIEGKLQFEIADKKVVSSKIKIVNDLSKLSFNKLRKFLPMVNDSFFPESLKGEWEIDIGEFVFGEEGISFLSVDSILNEVSVSFKEIVPGVSLDISKVRMEVKDFSLNNTFSLKVEAAYLSQYPNVFFETKTIIDKEQQFLMLEYSKITTNLSSFSLQELKSSLKNIKGGQLPDKLSGKVNFYIEEAKFDKNGLVYLNSTGEINEGLVKFNQIALPIDDISSSFQLTESKIDIEKLSLTLGRGKVNGSFVLTDYFGEQDSIFEFNIKDLNPGEIVEQKDQSIKINGLVSGSFSGKAKGLTVDRLADSLIGKGEFEVKEGEISDINILQTVLNKISILPNLVEKFKSSLPKRYVKKLEQKDTILSGINLRANIEKGVVAIDSLDVEADGFIFVGLGELNFDKKFYIDGSFFIPEDLSDSMIRSVSELKYLVNEENQIFIPVGVSGKAPDIKFSVDLGYIGKKIIKKRGLEEIIKVIDKALDRDEPRQVEEEPGGLGGKPKRIEEQLIENLIDSIFK